MKAFPTEVLDYIKSERVGVLAVQMLDNSPHAATVHFGYSEEARIFLFETYRPYRKCEALFGRDVSRASFVIGSNEVVMKTLQIDGSVRLLKENERELFDRVYLTRFPNKVKKAKDPNFVLFALTPTWWRFTDWTRSEGKVIISSEEEEFSLKNSATLRK